MSAERPCLIYGGEVRGIKVLVGRPEGKRLLRIIRSRWYENIKMDLQQVVRGHGLDVYGSVISEKISTLLHDIHRKLTFCLSWHFVFP